MALSCLPSKTEVQPRCVVQRLGQRSPKPSMRVRILPHLRKELQWFTVMVIDTRLIETMGETSDDRGSA